MHAVNLIARALRRAGDLPNIPGESFQGICAVTGQCGTSIHRGELLGKSFTNGDLLVAPQSDMVSIDAYLALTHKWERMSSWYCDGRVFARLDRQGVRNMVIGGAYGAQWAGYATTSYKKHGSIFTKVNTAGKAIWRFEMKDVDCGDRDRLMTIWDRLNLEIRGGMSRRIMENLDCPPFLIRQIGAKQWLDFERWARPIYQGALYQFMCYLLPNREELKNESA